ncbi:MAG: rRNA maturation RNase YbeY [Eubacteriaceae bacterium]|nr:rRNA maturation RNase YbeY [Eubacteriaceae bacterium]MDD4508017.1 rRNA maturation RNase YbeY [Eubacteriaceae bacterium]
MLTVTFDNQTPHPLDQGLKQKIEDYIGKTLETEGIDCEIRPFEISYSWVTPEEIHTLNATYRDVDRTTDVLSFPMLSYPQDTKQLTTPSHIPVLLGDIVINPEQAQKQGETYETGFVREVCYLTVHSVLHLLGYDHMEAADKSAMREREKAIMGDIN